ncbi:MAG: transposase [Blastocatellia bacterium]
MALPIHPFIFEKTIDSEIVIACFDYLSRIITKLTLVVVDGAPTHKSDAFKARLEEWEARGLYVYLLPAYSPELNPIEILWRMIKYDWLPLNAYESFKDLMRSLIAVLSSGGKSERFEFADEKATVGQKVYTIAREALAGVLQLAQGLFAQGRTCDQVLKALMPS